MDYQTVFKKMDELRKTGMYNEEQLEVIRYMCYDPKFNVDLILDPSISNDMMLNYYKLATQKKIDVSKYINEKWHLKGFSDKQLYYVIDADNKGQDISDITPNMSIEEIITNLNSKIAEERKINALNDTEFEMLKNYNLDLQTIEFLIRQAKLGNDINSFLKPNINQFSLDQIKYLFSIYSIGGDIKNIYDSNLSVEQMKQKMSSSKDSLIFEQELKQDIENRKKK